MRLSKPVPSCYKMLRVRQLTRDEEEGDCATNFDDPINADWLGLSPTAGMQHNANDLRQRAIPDAAVVRMCPWLQLDESFMRARSPIEESIFIANGRGLGYGMATFTLESATLANRRPDVFITQPPVTKAEAYLSFRATVGRSITVHAKFGISQSSGVTLSGLLESTWSAKDVAWSTDTKLDVETHAKLAATIKHQKRGSFALDTKRSRIIVDAIIVTDEEWETMCERLVEDKARNKAMSDEEYTAWISNLLKDVGSESLIQELLRIREDA